MSRAKVLPGILPARSAPTGISVLIVGGGVAGLLVALECWRKGHDVRLLEKSSSRVLTGDVLTVGTSAVRALQKWPDMAKENDRISYEMWISWHKINGDLISGPAPFRPNPPKNTVDGLNTEPPAKIYRHSHPTLHKMLADQVERVGITVEYGKQVVRYEEHAQSSKAYVILDTAEKIEADLVVAADGIGSNAHKITVGHEVRAQPTGFSIYRAMLPIDQALCDPVIDEKFPLLGDGKSSTQLWMGDSVYALFGRTEHEMIWYLTYPNRGSSIESWSNWVDPDEVLQITADIDGWPEFATRLIKATRKNQIHDFKLTWREPQPCWVSPGGRVVQIGDAAHSFLPSSGNGATQGMEDAVSLAACLNIAGKENVPWATRVHNKLRFERVSCLQLLGVLNHEMRNRSADASISQTKPIGILGSWIWKHDPEKYAEENYAKVFAHLTTGSEFLNTNIPPGHVCQPWTIDEVLRTKQEGREIVLHGDWE
ncbi:putative monooxygenase [Trichoderma barbatum]